MTGEKDEKTHSTLIHTAEALSVPKDVMLSAMIVTVTGKNDLYVENYNNIIEYSDCILKLQGKSSRIMIKGKRFELHFFSKNCLMLKGVICEIKYY